MASFLFLLGNDTLNNRGTHGLQDSNTTAIGSSGDPNNSTGGGGWAPIGYTVKHSVRQLAAAPGSGKDCNYRIKQNSSSPVNVSAVLTIANLATSVLTDVEGAIAVIDPTSNTTLLNTMHFMTEWTTGGPSSANSFYGHEYAPATPGVSLYGFGGILNSSSVSGSNGSGPTNANNAFGFFTAGAISSANTGTTALKAQSMPWPLKGKFGWIAVAWNGLTATNTIEFALSTTGASLGGTVSDLLGPFSLVGAGATWTATVDTSTTSAIVNPGDYVFWRAVRSAGASGTTSKIAAAVGFLAS